jgi:hypothetical protein
VPVEKFPTGAAVSSLPEGASSISGAILIGDPARPARCGSTRAAPTRSTSSRGRLALYGDVPTEEYLRFAAYLNPDLPVAVAFDEAHGTPQRWGRVPRTFIRTTEDRTVPLALQDRMIAEADAVTPGNRFATRTLASSHSAFASVRRSSRRRSRGLSRLAIVVGLGRQTRPNPPKPRRE